MKVALLGATGETGSSILNGLREDGSYEITLIVRPSSVEKAVWKALAEQGLELLSLDLSREIDPSPLRPFEVILSAIDNDGNEDQRNLATAAKAAGVKRFVPCGYTTICPPGVMTLRDGKEEVYNHVLRLKLGYTIVDVGYWHQVSFPRLPSGRVDQFLVRPENVIHGDGEAPNLLTDLRDIGRFVARIAKDPRTLNQKVFTWSEEISENEIYNLAERISGEKVDYRRMTAAEITTSVTDARAAAAADPKKWIFRAGSEYNYSKYIRRDNTRANALYLGYLDAQELYPDIKPIPFEQTFKEAIDGKLRQIYPHMPFEVREIVRSSV